MLTARTALYSFILFLFTVTLTAQLKSQVIQGEEIEAFLRKADIVALKTLDIGKTGPQKATLVLNGETRFGVFKTINESKDLMKFDDGRVDMNFQDNWKSEIAAYEIDKIIGLGMVPATVERTYKGVPGSLQIWVESMMSETEHMKNKQRAPADSRFNEMMHMTRLFDNMIYNPDRNLGNLLITKDWEIILIDHSRAFRPAGMLKSPKDLDRFSHSLLEGITKLNQQNLTEKAGKYLPKNQISGMLKRRDAILELAKKTAAKNGERATFY